MPEPSAQTPSSVPTGSGNAKKGSFPQCLLRRNPALSIPDFHTAWLAHARAGMPWAMDCGVTHYVQILDPTLADPALLPAGVNLAAFDAAAEMSIPGAEVASSEADRAARLAYWEECVVPGEKECFVGPNREFAVWIPAGTVTGRRVEILVDGEWVKDKEGKAVLDVEESRKEYEEWKGRFLAQRYGEGK